MIRAVVLSCALVLPMLLGLGLLLLYIDGVIGFATAICGTFFVTVVAYTAAVLHGQSESDDGSQDASGPLRLG